MALRNINLIVQKRPYILSNEVKVFFCKYNDPIYVKMEKLEIMSRLATDKNIDQVLGGGMGESWVAQGAKCPWMHGGLGGRGSWEAGVGGDAKGVCEAKEVCVMQRNTLRDAWKAGKGKDILLACPAEGDGCSRNAAGFRLVLTFCMPAWYRCCWSSKSMRKRSTLTLCARYERQGQE